jgi:glycosyltransferase involved in cell wall biosynthesis
MELRLLGCPDDHGLPTMRGITVTTRSRYDEAAMMEEMLQFDIGLFPAPGDLEDYAVRGALKAMLYMTAGVAPVALRAGDCASLIVDGVTGMLVDEHQDWCNAIQRLVRDAGLRRAIGERARAVVERTHSLEAVAEVLDRALHAVLALRQE